MGGIACAAIGRAFQSDLWVPILPDVITTFSTGPFQGMDPDELQQRLASPSRLAALRASGLLDPGTQNEVLDRLARLTARVLGVPTALVTLVDTDAQRFPGLYGLDNWAGAQRSTPLSYSFCQYVAGQNAPLIVDDASAVPLLSQNRAYTELDVAAYAGVPLRASNGECLGAVCAINSVPVHWTPEVVEVLEDLARAATAEIELRGVVRELAEAQEQLQRLALHDPLTQLLNRRGFAEASRQHLALAQRTFAPFTLLVLDLDAFKVINDTLGHDTGDAALVEMTDVLRDLARDSDIVGRLGGDEFAVLLTGTGDRNVATFRARLEAALAARNSAADRAYVLKASVGSATWLPEYPASMATLHRLADEAMYADKRGRQQQSGTEPSALNGSA
jgi:diguanylate cyclase (GGDEF)-like protein